MFSSFTTQFCLQANDCPQCLILSWNQGTFVSLPEILDELQYIL